MNLNLNKKGLIKKLHWECIWIQDVFALYYDLRPCIRFGLSKRKNFLLKSTLPKLNLKMLIYRYGPRNKPIVLISKNKSTLQKAYYLDKEYKQSKLSVLLGYPRCYVKFWEKNKHKKIPAPVLTLKKTLDKTKLNFMLNYLFNFDSRILTGSLTYLDNLNRNNYACWNVYLIPHIPCSFDCKPSIKYTEHIFKLIENQFPKYSNKLKSYLGSPVLFIDDYRFLAFKGVFKGNTLSYQKTFAVRNLIDEKILESVANGNKLIILKSAFMVKKFNVKTEIFNFLA